jgi:hypothetical protein
LEIALKDCTALKSPTGPVVLNGYIQNFPYVQRVNDEFLLLRSAGYCFAEATAFSANSLAEVVRYFHKK